MTTHRKRSGGGAHRARRWKFIVPGGGAAVALALVWSAMGMPGWADESTPRTAAEVADAVETAPMGAVACDDGEDGDGKGRYQAVYVHRQGAAPREGGPQAVRQVLWDIDQTFEASAKRYAGDDESRRPRFVQDEECRPAVLSVEVTGLGEKHSMQQARDAARSVVEKELTRRLGGEARFAEWEKTHRELFFYDTGEPDGCGTAGTPSPESRATLHGGWAEVSWGCASESALTHEMVHQFGVSHCDEDKAQGNDPICRGYDETPRCDGPRAASVLDCGLDGFAYFHPRPAKGSYLATHPEENVARSPYLMKNRQARAVKARLVDADGGKCLTARGAQSSKLGLAACGGDGQTWVREIGGRGYFKFKLGERCLEKRDGGRAVLADCAAGKSAQHWWVNANVGDRLDGYHLVHRSGGDPVTVGDATTFRMRQA
ncbi:ricin-type beta-trefoil lectin domain protein [Streptomyces diacarni]|uniref:ricin-type beta-trefoil lectin domain protein n=1 Tax=Streptomyces diacarni TaxID=2800381 RepID=UPI0011C0394F|nr:ricin-type beta-trefoil lectin domain protein [Streptomyces diacarni]